jgi:hypothetical protein
MLGQKSVHSSNVLMEIHGNFRIAEGFEHLRPGARLHIDTLGFHSRTPGWYLAHSLCHNGAGTCGSGAPSQFKTAHRDAFHVVSLNGLVNRDDSGT